MVPQTIDSFRLLEFISLILIIITSSLVIARSIKKGYKDYVDSRVNILDMRATTIEKEIDELKKDNQREHDAIKKEFVERVNMIFEWIKEKSK